MAFERCCCCQERCSSQLSSRHLNHTCRAAYLTVVVVVVVVLVAGGQQTRQIVWLDLTIMLEFRIIIIIDLQYSQHVRCASISRVRSIYLYIYLALVCIKAAFFTENLVVLSKLECLMEFYIIILEPFVDLARVQFTLHTPPRCDLQRSSDTFCRLSIKPRPSHLGC